MEDLITQLEGLPHDPLGDSLEKPFHKLLGLDKELRSIRGFLKVEMMKKVQFEEHIKRENHKLSKIWDNPEYNDGIQEEIRNRIKRLNEDLKVRLESIDFLKGRLTNQITGIKDMIAKVLDKDTSLAENIRTLFREQGIMITSVLRAIAMTISMLVEALLPSSGSAASQGKIVMMANQRM